MSDIFDHEYDAWCNREENDEPTRSNWSVTCRHCGGKCAWEIVESRWRLLNRDNNKLHECRHTPELRMSHEHTSN